MMFVNFIKRLVLINFFMPIVLAGSISSQINSINLELTSQFGDSQVFQTGDELSFLVSLDRAAYLYVIYQTSQGDLIQLIPNAAIPSHYFSADIFIPIPSDQSKVKFTVGKPYGHEVVYAYAVDTSVQFKGQAIGNGLLKLSMTTEQLKKKLLNAAGKYFGSTQFKLETRLAQ